MILRDVGINSCKALSLSPLKLADHEQRLKWAFKQCSPGSCKSHDVYHLQLLLFTHNNCLSYREQHSLRVLPLTRDWKLLQEKRSLPTSLQDCHPKPCEKQKRIQSRASVQVSSSLTHPE